MNFRRSHAGSPYMQWAKLCSTARFNLASSGIASFPLEKLGVSIEQLEINGPTIYGYQPLLEAIASRYAVPKECIVTAAGTSMSNYLAMAATTEPGDEILVEQPTYELIPSAAKYLGLRVKQFVRPRESGFQIDLEDLERKLSPRTRLIAITNLHNPSGALTSEKELQRIGELAGKAGARVLVDEVYLETMFAARPRTALRLGMDRFIVTNSLTKAYGLSGLRCGWVLASPELVQRMWRINDLHGATPAFLAEQLSVIAFEKLSEVTAHVEPMLRRNRLALRNFLDSREDLDSVWPEHGAVVFPRLKTGNADELCSLLREEFDTTVVPGRFFEMPDHFRIGIGGTTQSVEESLEQLGRGLDAYSRMSRKTAH